MALLLARRLRALPQHALRVGWFAHWVAETDLEVVASELDALLGAAESYAPGVTPALVTVVGWIGGALDAERLVALAELARTNALFHASRMLAYAADCPSDLAREQAQHVPDHRPGRRLTLGERKNLARRIGREDIDRLVRDPHPSVIEQLLVNPRLKESDLIRLTTYKPSQPSSLVHLYRDGRWLVSARVRLSLLLNPTVPLWQTVPLLWLCARQDLSQIALAAHLAAPLKSAATSRLALCPPIRATVSSLTLH